MITFFHHCVSSSILHIASLAFLQTISRVFYDFSHHSIALSSIAAESNMRHPPSVSAARNRNSSVFVVLQPYGGPGVGADLAERVARLVVALVLWPGRLLHRSLLRSSRFRRPGQPRPVAGPSPGRSRHPASLLQLSLPLQHPAEPGVRRPQLPAGGADREATMVIHARAVAGSRNE
jgi:hypothetical protein